MKSILLVAFAAFIPYLASAESSDKLTALRKDRREVSDELRKLSPEVMKRSPELEKAMAENKHTSIAVGKQLESNPGLKQANADIASAFDGITRAVGAGDKVAKDAAQANYSAAIEARTIEGEKIPEIAKLMEENRQKGAAYLELEKKVFSEDPATKDLVAKREKLDKEIAAERKK